MLSRCVVFCAYRKLERRFSTSQATWSYLRVTVSQLIFGDHSVLTLIRLLCVLLLLLCVSIVLLGYAAEWIVTQVPTEKGSGGN